MLQSNLSIAAMLYSGHLFITDTFSWNRPNHGQTLIENPYIADTFIADTCDSGRKFLEPPEHFLWKSPFYSGHAKFWGKLKTREVLICEVLIEKNWYWNIKRDIYHLLSSCHCIQTLYLFWFKPASNVSHI